MYLYLYMVRDKSHLASYCAVPTGFKVPRAPK